MSTDPTSEATASTSPKLAAAAASPIQNFKSQDTLDGHVVDLSEGFKIHGHDILSRMCQGASFGQLALLTLTGSQPTPAEMTCFERALQLGAMMDVGETPCHAARLARAQQATPQGVASIACINLAQRACAILDRCEALHAWLAEERVDLCAERSLEGHSAPSEGVELLRGFHHPVLLELAALKPSREECLVALLHVSGLTQRWQKEAALTMSGFPVAMAEAFFAPPKLRQYPIRVPEFAYQHQRAKKE